MLSESEYSVNIALRLCFMAAS